MKKTFAAFWVLILLTGVAGAFSLNLDPPGVDLSIAPGESQAGILRVRNNGEQTITVAAYTQDWLYAKDGSKIFKPTDTTSYSCAKWINLYPAQFEILPGAAQEVKYTLTAPPDAAGGKVAVVFFEAIAGSKENKTRGRVLFSGRIGTIFYVEIAGNSVKAGRISDLKISRPDENKPLQAEITFKNSGNTHLKAQGSLAILDEKGNLAGREKIARFNTLPGESRTQTVEFLEKLSAEKYLVVVTLDYGGEEPAIAEQNLEIKAGGRLADLALRRIAPNTVKCHLKYVNSGNTTIKISGKLTLAESANQRHKSFNLDETLILPNSSRNFVFYWRGFIPADTYRATAAINQDGQTEVETKEFKL